MWSDISDGGGVNKSPIESHVMEQILLKKSNATLTGLALVLAGRTGQQCRAQVVKWRMAKKEGKRSDKKDPQKLKLKGLCCGRDKRGM